jgi:LacI family transcriptional regulator
VVATDSDATEQQSSGGDGGGAQGSAVRGALTSRSIAALAGVSQTTVSRVLAGHPHVSEATRRRVERVLEETGYTPNAAARTMRTRRTGVVGVVVGRVTNPFYPQLIEALHREITARRLQMSVWISEGDAEDGGELAVLDAVRRSALDGLVYTTVTSDSPSLRAAVERGAPIVLLNRTIPELRADTVASDNHRGAEAVARYFLAHGHRRLGLVSGPANVSTTYEREAGFRAGAADPAWSDVDVHVVHGDFTHAGGADALATMLAGKRKPTAVFCVNDVVAFGVIDEARRRGLRVPDDLWVVGYDDTDMASWTSYDLTTVRQPVERMAKIGVDLLLERIAGREPRRPRDIRLEAVLVIRSSTASAP